MTLSLEAQHQTCRRQLERLRAPDLGRHDLLDIATALLLLIGSIDSDDGDDVAGHSMQPGRGVDPEADAEVREDLAWIQTHARTGSLGDLRDRTRRAANQLCRHLGTDESDEAIVQDA